MEDCGSDAAKCHRTVVFLSIKIYGSVSVFAARFPVAGDFISLRLSFIYFFKTRIDVLFKWKSGKKRRRSVSLDHIVVQRARNQ